MASFELGGFAEAPKEVSDEFREEDQLRDFEAFNYCLAEDYAAAMYDEDFDSLGHVDFGLFNNICKWINYDESLGNEKLKKDIETGLLITKNNRTFLSAIVAAKNVSWGEFYALYGVYDPKIIVMLIEYVGDGNKTFPIEISIKAQDELNKLFTGICEEIESHYISAGKNIEYLKRIRDGIRILYFPKDLSEPPIPSGLLWTKHLKRTPRIK